jgi:GTP-binding protein
MTRARQPAPGPARGTGGPADRQSALSNGPPDVPGGFVTSDIPSGRPPVRFDAVEFVGTFPDPLVRLDPELPEVAFVGRSNVGKSSLINAVLGKPGIARVSGTPGKTRALNVFRLPDFYLVDLPGYGYAKADKVTRAAILKILDRYLLDRPTVGGVVWLLDIRRAPSPEDQRIAQHLATRGHPVLAVLTKADKLGRSAQAVQARMIARSLGLEQDQVQLTSSTTGLGIAELARSVANLFRRVG